MQILWGTSIAEIVIVVAIACVVALTALGSARAVHGLAAAIDDMALARGELPAGQADHGQVL